MGWSPRVAKTTPICEIYTALDGRLDYLRYSSPFQGGPVIDKPETKLSVADQVRKVFGGKKDGE